MDNYNKDLNTSEIFHNRYIEIYATMDEKNRVCIDNPISILGKGIAPTYISHRGYINEEGKICWENVLFNQDDLSFSYEGDIKINDENIIVKIHAAVDIIN